MAGMNDLRERIAAAQKEKQESVRRNDTFDNANLGVRVGTELAAAIIVGGVLGYALDLWLSTEPLLFLILLFLGIITGFVNVYRVIYGLRPLGDPARLHSAENTGKEEHGEDEKSPNQE